MSRKHIYDYKHRCETKADGHKKPVSQAHDKRRACVEKILQELERLAETDGIVNNNAKKEK